jgi:tetrahydromethanopterin S-methyltransferase subunit G
VAADMNEIKTEGRNTMEERIQIGAAVKTGWATYFGNFSKYIGRTIGFWIATFVGLLIITAIINAMFEIDYRADEPLEILRLSMTRHIGVSIGKLILMGLLMTITGSFISLTFKLRGVRQQEEYPFGTILGLGCLLSVVLVLASLTVMFWANISPGFAKLVSVAVVIGEVLFKGLIVLAMCHVISDGAGVKASLKRSWASLTSSPGRFIGFHLLAALVGVSGFIVIGFGILVTLPILFVAWAIAYEQLVPEAKEVTENAEPEN